MKRILIVIAILGFGSAISYAQDSSGFRMAANIWEIESSKGEDPQKAQAAFNKMLAAWVDLPQNQKNANWSRIALSYVGQAEIKFKARDAAADALRSAALLSQQFNGRLEYATKSPNSFFDRLARIQTEIASKTGSDPLASMVSYLFQKKGDEYVVARQELDPEVKGVTIDGISESESLVQAHYFNANEGKVTFENTRWFIGPKGNVADTINHATREVLQDQYGRIQPKPIQSPILSSSVQAMEIKSAAQTTPAPAAVTPVQQPKSTPPETPSPSPTVAEAKSFPWPWIIGSILVLAIAGGILLKLRRK
jgi:hypothetical protein